MSHPPEIKDSYTLRVLLCIAIALLLVLLYFVAFARDTAHSGPNRYKYTNLNVVRGQQVRVLSKAEYTSLKNELESLIRNKKKDGAFLHASVYLRDLDRGPTLGIETNADFAPASLMKLPLAIAYLRYSEDNAELLEKRLLYTDLSAEQIAHTSTNTSQVPTLKDGQMYRIEELIKAMLIDSDNRSFYLLVNYFNQEIPDGSNELRRVLQELGLIDPRSPDDEIVTVRNIAGLLRILYNSSYLTHENSERVLSWLAESTYSRGLRAGLPDETLVAHKFGSRILSNGKKQLHDCGIIYFPQNPYTLCVMTEGDDWEEMQNVISTISRLVHKEFNARRL